MGVWRTYVESQRCIMVAPTEKATIALSMIMGRYSLRNILRMSLILAPFILRMATYKIKIFE